MGDGSPGLDNINLSELTDKMNREQAMRQRFMDEKIQVWVYAVLKNKIHSRKFRQAFRGGTQDDILRLKHYMEQYGLEIHDSPTQSQATPEGIACRQEIAITQDGKVVAHKEFNFHFQRPE